MLRMKLLVAILLMLIAGCEERATVGRNSRDARLEAISLDKWDSLAQKKIFFGHQSVGQNIVDGVRDLMSRHAEIRLDIRETVDPKDLERPVFAHAAIGQNRNPVSKIDHFRQILESGVGARADIALFKLCYVDIDRTTDVEALFRRYDETITYLRTKFPDLVLIPVTVPLTTGPGGIKEMIKHALGGESSNQDDNMKRNAFNEMMRKKYGTSVFDLAESEATQSNGEKAEFRRGGDTCYVLNRAYSSDGGHLNELGRQVIAADLLWFLASVRNK